MLHHMHVRRANKETQLKCVQRRTFDALVKLDILQVTTLRMIVLICPQGYAISTGQLFTEHIGWVQRGPQKKRIHFGAVLLNFAE